MVAPATSCLPNHFIMIIAQARPQTVTSNPQVCLPVLGNYCLDRHRLSGQYPHWAPQASPQWALSSPGMFSWKAILLSLLHSNTRRG